MEIQTIRAFIAIELPTAVRQTVGRIQAHLRQTRLPFRWVRPENIHLTLKFLGDIPVIRVDAVHAAMMAASTVPPPELTVQGIGGFPNLRRPRVLWSGLGGQLDSLARIQQCLDDNLALIGFEKERHGFKGHLTLGRAKGRVDPDLLGAALQALPETESLGFVPVELALLKSDLRPTGAVYTRLAVSTLSSR
jgi:2'-5' RNA ligase